MGFNTGDILESLEEKYNNDIIPKINTLSNDDKEKLSSLISSLLEDNSINKRFIEELMNILNNKKNSR